MGWNGDYESEAYGVDSSSSSTSTSSNTGSDGGNDNNDFFTGTFDDPGEEGFSGPAYDGQYGGSDVVGWSVYGTAPTTQDPYSSMSGYFDYALSDFSAGQAGISSFFGSPSVSDYSLTRQQAEAGYSVGQLGPSYGITQLPTDYYESDNIFGFGGGLKGPQRTTRSEAEAYAQYRGYEMPDWVGSDPQKASNFFGRAIQAVAGSIGRRFGTDEQRGAVIDPQTGFIGEVYDDMSAVDAIGNFIGLGVPGGARVDQAVVRGVSPGTSGAYQYGYSNTLFGESTFVQEKEAYDARMAAQAAAEEAARAAGGGDDAVENEYTRAGAAELTLSASSLRSRNIIKQALMPSVRSYFSDLGPAISLFGARYGFREGGKVPPMLDDIQQSLQKNLTMGIPSDDDIRSKLKAGEDINTILIDPNDAITADDLAEVFAYNKRVYDMAENTPMASGGAAGEPQMKQAGGPTGFVEQAPENLSEAATVADDVPIDVEEGTFVINAPAAEYAGTDYIKKIILDAMAEAERQGIDISTDGSKITRENAVSLLVSKGEVLIPPVLAKIIGYGTLNKINNRGMQEVERRVAENGQSPEAEALDEQPQNPAEGTAMAADGGVQVRGTDVKASRGKGRGQAQENVTARTEIAGEGFVVRPEARYGKQEATATLPNGVVIDNQNKQVGMTINGEIFLDDASIRAGYGKDKYTGNTDVSFLGNKIHEESYGQSVSQYSIGGSKGPVSIDYSVVDPGTVEKIRSGRAVYRYSDDGELYLEGDNQGTYRLGFLQRF